LAGRQLFQTLYRKLAITNLEIYVNFIYASRGNVGDLGESIAARGRQIIDIVLQAFSNVTAEFVFLGAKELIAKFREAKQFTLELPIVDFLTGKGDGYIALVELGRYYEFISDGNGELRRYLFDSNIRDYLGHNKVNDDILSSLETESGADFWWLNNGVTILATKAVINGKTIHMQDIQIVNGLQTTETIHRHFSSGNSSSKDLSLAVKIVVSNDATLRDRIIVATNNQSTV
jgi:hypothetical protein